MNSSQNMRMDIVFFYRCIFSVEYSLDLYAAHRAAPRRAFCVKIGRVGILNFIETK